MQPLTEVMECRHSLDVQVRFNDYDMFCHLNNGAYMQFLDLGKTDYFGSLLGGVLTPERLSIVVAGITCNFVEPSLPGQRVRVLTRALHLGTASLLLAQQVIDSDTRRLKCSAIVAMVGYDVEGKTSKPISDDLRRAVIESDAPDTSK